MTNAHSTLKKTMTPTNSKIAHAIARVMEQNPWKDGKQDFESRRMYHERIAQLFGREVSLVCPRLTVRAWSIYGGEDEYAWEYAVRAGSWEFIVKREPPA
jgi:hypothetical protein